MLVLACPPWQFHFLLEWRCCPLPTCFTVPATAFSYVPETELAKYILNEHIGWQRWVGASRVGCGVLLVSLEV
jgi:drug/metabolite transporter (DMT)-like permease